MGTRDKEKRQERGSEYGPHETRKNVFRKERSALLGRQFRESRETVWDEVGKVLNETRSLLS